MGRQWHTLTSFKNISPRCHVRLGQCVDDPEATSPGGGEELERAGDSARSSIGVDAETEARAYLAADRDETARVNEFNRQEFWKDLVHAIRTSFVITLAGICWLSVLGIAGATLFVVLLLRYCGCSLS